MVIPLSGRAPFSMFPFQLTHQFPILLKRPLLMLCFISQFFQALGQLRQPSRLKSKRLKLTPLTFPSELTLLVLSGPLSDQTYNRRG